MMKKLLFLSIILALFGSTEPTRKSNHLISKYPHHSRRIQKKAILSPKHPIYKEQRMRNKPVFAPNIPEPKYSDKLSNLPSSEDLIEDSLGLEK